MDFQTLNMLFKCSKDFSHKKIRNCGLNNTECLICSYVYQHENCSQDDIVKGLNIEKSTLTKAAAILEEKGFIKRRKDKTDGRKKLLRLTKAGLESCSEIINLHDRWFSEVMTALNEEEQEQFEAYCVKLLKKAEEMSDSKADN